MISLFLRLLSSIDVDEDYRFKICMRSLRLWPLRSVCLPVLQSARVISDEPREIEFG